VTPREQADQAAQLIRRREGAIPGMVTMANIIAEAIEAAVVEEREACAATVDRVVAEYEQADALDWPAGRVAVRIADLIRARSGS
jgi:hypothetical protein